MGLSLYAWLGAVAIGLALGMLGSGGSILTVPVLVYFVGEPDKVAIAESLAIVGLIALVGAIPYSLQGLVVWRSLWLFGIPSIVGTYLGAWMSQWVSGAMQLSLFAVVMLLAAWMMVRNPKHASQAPHPRPFWKIALDGLVVGALTGLVGVGGGFLIIPALVVLGGLTMQQAVGTSLWLIALKSGSGFWKYMQLLPTQGYSINWEVIGMFSLIGSIGSMMGNRIAVRLPQSRLRRGFAVLLVLMGAFILWQNLPKLSGASVAQSDTPEKQETFRTLPPKEAWKWIEEGAQAIDVRESYEVALERVPRFKNIPLSELKERMNEIDKQKRVVLLCRSGRRSAIAAQELLKAGYPAEQVANVEGGLIRWKAENLPTELPEESNRR